MRLFTTFRRFRIAGVLAILAVWSASSLGGLFLGIWEEMGVSSQVSETEIKLTNHSTGVCHHHPQGCPKDCFCPKVTGDSEVGENESQATETLAGSSLVQCTEQAPSAVLEFSQVFISVPAWELLDPPASFVGRAPEKIAELSDSFGSPPQKIPIL